MKSNELFRRKHRCINETTDDRPKRQTIKHSPASGGIPDKNVIILLIALCAACSILQASNTGSISGLVMDSESNSPLFGVNVMIKNTLLGSSTDNDGRFFIEGVPPGKYVLNVSRIGYHTVLVENVQSLPGQETAVQVRLVETPIDINPIIVTAGKHPQALGSANQDVEVIGSQRISEMQARRVDESMLTMPGVYMIEKNISIRGSSGYTLLNLGTRVLFMIDGVPVLTADLKSITWDMLPLLDIERIEVVKGAGSALYGSAAMGGVVNVITQTPSPQGRFQFRTQAGMYDDPYYKEWKWTDKRLHYERADISYSRQVGRLGFHLSASRFESTGYMENTEVKQWNLSGKFNYQFKNRSTLTLYAAWLDNVEGGYLQWLNQNSPLKVPPFNREDGLAMKTEQIYLKYHLPLSAKFALAFRFSRLESDFQNQITAYDPSKVQPGEGSGMEIQGDWLPHPLHHLTFGTEYRWEKSGSEYFEYHKGYTLAPYLQDEWIILSNLNATLGARLDHYELIDESSDTRLSPKFGLNYRPSTRTTLRSSIGSGFRAATVFEKNLKADYAGFNAIPNPNLRAEHSWAFDLGCRQSLTDNAFFDVTVFQTDYWDMIEPVINFLGTIQFQNYIRARIRGLEFSGESWWWHRRLGLNLNFSWIDPMDIEHNVTLPYRPRFFGSVIGIFNLGPASLQAEYRYASRIDQVQINPLDERVPLKLLNFRAEVKWRMLTLQLALNNALNYNYTQVERRMAEIRHGSVGLLVDF